ncbi:hypothetical protein TTRE_0000879301 [Trichuris trichiura]|uniref:Uncharacterized protein n=1 Tax=Trichuris trichiura TaxID=36087 RepID=A0A077ZKZ7_TRITR|nr:hypothetical protein TTRE_0000879301 [Trichuris trichiura]
MPRRTCSVRSARSKSSVPAPSARSDSADKSTADLSWVCELLTNLTGRLDRVVLTLETNLITPDQRTEEIDSGQNLVIEKRFLASFVNREPIALPQSSLGKRRQKPHLPTNPKLVRTTVMTPVRLCIVCESDAHSITLCPVFSNKNITDRLKVVRHKRLCLRCPKPVHVKQDCRSFRKFSVRGFSCSLECVVDRHEQPFHACCFAMRTSNRRTHRTAHFFGRQQSSIRSRCIPTSRF